MFIIGILLGLILGVFLGLLLNYDEIRQLREINNTLEDIIEQLYDHVEHAYLYRD